MLSTLGLEVVRHIPIQTIAGLATGAYSVHGGVVRDVGGRIVAHLLAAGSTSSMLGLIPGATVLSGIIGNAQLYSIARNVKELQSTVNTVMTVASAGAALSGIGLIANVAGTAFLARKLDRVQSQLSHIERLLNEQHLSVLRGAVDNLRHAEHAADESTRKAMLIAAKTDFSRSAHFYGSQFADPRGLEEILALDNSFVLAAFGAVLALSELGMRGAASAEFEHYFERWQALSRKHIGKYLLGGTPQRLLFESKVEDVSAAELVRYLDFVNATNKSWLWIDELRNEKAGRGMSLPSWGNDKAFTTRVELARVLTAKDRVLDGFGAHLRLLDEKQLTVSEFRQKVEGAREALGVSSACVVPKSA